MANSQIPASLEDAKAELARCRVYIDQAVMVQQRASFLDGWITATEALMPDDEEEEIHVKVPDA